MEIFEQITNRRGLRDGSERTGRLETENGRFSDKVPR